MLFQPREPPISQCASVIQNWLNANGFIEKNEWPSNSPYLNPLDCHIWGTMPEKYHKLQPKHNTTDELKVALQTILGRDATRTHQQGGGDVLQVPACLRGCGCQWWSLPASAVTLSVCKSASSSHHQTNWLFSEPPTDYRWIQCLECCEMARLSWLK